MKRRDAVLTIPAAAIAGALTPLRKLKANPATVTQEELRRVGSLWNESEALAADIRCRLEAGADLEHGELGVATWGETAITETGGGGSISIGGICIDDADDIKRECEQYPESDRQAWI